MNSIFISIFLLIVSFIILFKSSDWFIEGTISLANLLRIPVFLIGVLIVGFGTSLPEMLVSIISSWQQHSAIALGNAYGSNIFNITFVLGGAAVVYPLIVSKRYFAIELPLLLLLTLFSIWIACDGRLTFTEALWLVAIFVVILLFLTFWYLRHPEEKQGNNDDFNPHLCLSRGQSLLFIGAGLTLLLLSSSVVVDSAVTIARYYEVPDSIIGLTIIAMGTSLPEFAAAVAAAKKQESDLVLGNIIGSNIFNTLIVVGISGLISAPLYFENSLLNRDLLISLGLTLLVWLSSIPIKGFSGKIGRIKGVILILLLLIYFAYLAKIAFL